MKSALQRRKKPTRGIFPTIFVMAVLACVCFKTPVYALDRTISITGAIYELDADSRYAYSSETASSSGTHLSSLQLVGSVTETGKTGGVPAYKVSGGALDLLFSFDKSILNADDDQWHLVKDKTKKVDDLTLSENILSGALILQSSLDGKTWTEEKVETNIFTEDADFSDAIYRTKYIQQQNGCYFRLIVAYKMEIKTGSHKTAVFFTKDDTAYKKVVEVYEFYVYAAAAKEPAHSANDTPRKELGGKINTGHDNGFSGNKTIDRNDPHFGWDLGTFVINGYTRDTRDGDTPVFLKNVGDKVTLWFRLNQDIDCLNGDSKLTISEDTNGYDREFEIPPTDFGRGTLIIRYTNEQGVAEEPVIYTNYLAANTRTGADTKVV